MQCGDSVVIDDRQANLGMRRTDRGNRLADDGAEPAAVDGDGLLAIGDLDTDRQIGA
jgi:hypothetical protein